MKRNAMSITMEEKCGSTQTINLDLEIHVHNHQEVHQQHIQTTKMQSTVMGRVLSIRVKNLIFTLVKYNGIINSHRRIMRSR